MSSSPLFGKLAIVTGAGSGIGRATCRLLVRDGARVIAADSNLKAAQETAYQLGSENSSAVKVDVSLSDSISEALDACLDKYNKPPSIVVNSAGITRDGWLLKMPECDYDDVYSVNLKGTFMMTQQFANAMIEHNITQGSVVNLSSIVAKMNNAGQANYAATKAGVISFTKVAAKEFGKFNIRVNAVMPGFIQTPMISTVPDPIRKEIIEKCPLNRLGKPEEVAEVIAFLVSERACFVNGAAIEVTGGL